MKGGTDFVGDDYNANDPSSVPQPDTNPLDCNGHGSHTAGTLAGFGVTSGGATYGGPYNGSISTNPSDWKVFPGVAPRRDIYAYRVFGCSGSSSIVDLAINQAVADGMNVISMSLGSDFGGNDDPTSVAAQNAVNDGVSVVASAGNAGGNAYTVGSPSTANGVLSVAAMDGTTPTFPGGHFALSTGKTLDAINANGATFSDGTTLPVVVVHDSSQPGGVSLGCSTAAFQAANVTGKLAVVQRGTCARVAKAIFGSDAGAAAVAMINNAAGYPPFEGDITSNPDTGDPHAKITIPFFGISGTVTGTDGTNLIAADGANVTLTNNTIANPGYKTTTSFSSGGPRNPDSAPKPDVIAPGLSVISAGVGTGTGSAVISGTSMACPMTAGIAALVKQVHPGWDGLQIKAAIMNTADRSLNTLYNVRRAGAGVVQAQKAVNSTVLATDGRPARLDRVRVCARIGCLHGPEGDHADEHRLGRCDVRLERRRERRSAGRGRGRLAEQRDGSARRVDDRAGLAVDLGIGVRRSCRVTTRSPSAPGAVNTVRGDIVATKTAGDASAQNLAVPYLVAPRGLSNVAAGAPAAWTKSNGPDGKGFDSTLPLTNSGIHAGTADLYAWGIHDANEGGAADGRS